MAVAQVRVEMNAPVTPSISLNVQEWNCTLLGVILGITSFGVDIYAQNSGIHSQKSDSDHYFGVDSTILRVDFHSKWNDP